MSEPLSDDYLIEQRLLVSNAENACIGPLTPSECSLLLREIWRLRVLVAKLSLKGLTVTDQHTEKGVRVTKLVTDSGAKATAFKRGDCDA